MKSEDKDKKLIIIYVICSLIFTLSFYCLVTNYYHYQAVNKKIIVSDMDNDYALYKKNVVTIENNLQKSNKSKELYSVVKKAMEIMKQDGLFRIVPGDKLGYRELFGLNKYFIENMYNNFWVVNLKNSSSVSPDLAKMMDILINNATYLENDLLNNSDFFYQKSNHFEDDITGKYRLVVKNYYDFSYIILNLSNKLGDNNG